MFLKYCKDITFHLYFVHLPVLRMFTTDKTKYRKSSVDLTGIRKRKSVQTSINSSRVSTIQLLGYMGSNAFTIHTFSTVEKIIFPLYIYTADSTVHNHCLIPSTWMCANLWCQISMSKTSAISIGWQWKFETLYRVKVPLLNQPSALAVFFLTNPQIIISNRTACPVSLTKCAKSRF